MTHHEIPKKSIMASARQREQAAEAASVKNDNWHCRPGQTAPHGHAPSRRCVKRSDAQQLNKRSRRPQWPGTRTTKAVKKHHVQTQKARKNFEAVGYLRAESTHAPYQLCTCTASACHLKYNIGRAASCSRLCTIAANLATVQHQHLLMNVVARDLIRIFIECVI